MDQAIDSNRQQDIPCCCSYCWHTSYTIYCNINRAICHLLIQAMVLSLISQSFTSKIVIVTTIVAAAFLSMDGVNSAPTTNNSTTTVIETSESNLDGSHIHKGQVESSENPPAGVFVSPWSGLDGRSNVRVGLPFIFGMDLNRNRDRSSGNQTRLDLGVLGGLVRVSLDRFRGVNGTKSGPVEVSIFGIPVTSG